MKFITLFTGEDNKSYFKEVDAGFEKKHPLGNYSKKFLVKGMMFRDFEEGSSFDWHTAPQPQYIIYLEGEVEVEASSGEKRVFRPGDVLFATDLVGKGHVTRTLTKGRSVVVTTSEQDESEITLLNSKL
jgi:quercetin dioxygenase-like cupin family protein